MHTIVAMISRKTLSLPSHLGGSSTPSQDSAELTRPPGLNRKLTSTPNTMALTMCGKKITARTNRLPAISRSTIVSANASTKTATPTNTRILNVFSIDVRKNGSSTSVR